MSNEQIELERQRDFFVQVLYAVVKNNHGSITVTEADFIEVPRIRDLVIFVNHDIERSEYTIKFRSE